ncbi:glutamate-5-semialdehyde dehydrogenase [Candidatus Poribacteria bacterium]|nr:glutamate-5-semialdehyde dehydrogenase [Candidatus Poribacteria bacterium]
MTTETRVREQALAAKRAARTLAALSSATKTTALMRMAEALTGNVDALQSANQLDLDAGQANDLTKAMLDRLALTQKVIDGMADGLRQIAALPDPVGNVDRMWVRPNGLRIGKMRVPLGVVGIIYESRPNVTADAAGLCIKSGNAVVLRGGSEAIHSNTAIVRLLRSAAAESGLPAEAIQIVETTDRRAVGELLKLDDIIDVIVPRGGKGLIRFVMENSTIPVVKHEDGICHTYVDRRANLDMAEGIAYNAKVQRPSVCNAMETLLVHADVADEFLPRIAARLTAAGVELRGCERTRHLLPEAAAATEDDWRTEYLDLILSVRVVDSLDDAVAHIEEYGSHHSDAIVTDDYEAAQRFLLDVDSATVYVNASTRFTDGYEFGLGAEVGISTQKLHARGPMGIDELTTYKYIVYGSGQVRG